MSRVFANTSFQHYFLKPSCPALLINSNRPQSRHLLSVRNTAWSWTGLGFDPSQLSDSLGSTKSGPPVRVHTFTHKRAYFCTAHPVNAGRRDLRGYGGFKMSEFLDFLLGSRLYNMEICYNAAEWLTLLHNYCQAL